MSCGSGLFSRRFVASGKFAGVIAADFSESMLNQTAQFFRDDPKLDPRFGFSLPSCANNALGTACRVQTSSSS